jgi:hypothetical protein
MQLQLEDAEVTLLRTILERHLGDFRMEIGKTEDYDMRQWMKRDEQSIKSMLERLGSPVAN